MDAPVRPGDPVIAFGEQPGTLERLQCVIRSRGGDPNSVGYVPEGMLYLARIDQVEHDREALDGQT